MIRISLYFLFLLTSFLSCQRQKSDQNQTTLMSLQLIDRNGFNETISAKERLDQYKGVDFFSSQPYKKVVRVYERNSQGKIKSVITSYHENGQLWQTLEAMDGRAFGSYREWYPSGKLRIEAELVEGIGDVALECMSSWVFDAKSKIYDEQGRLQSLFSYEKGVLEGPSTHYYPTGEIKKTLSFHKNLEEGDEIFFDKTGKVIGKRTFVRGLLEGAAYFEGDSLSPKYEEKYEKGLLTDAYYFSMDGKEISKVLSGEGFKSFFHQGLLHSQMEYKEGRRQGEVRTFYPTQTIHTRHEEINGEKHGEEWVYYPKRLDRDISSTKLCLTWYKGKLQGKIRSWYPSGALESEREFYDNKKNGPASAFYKDGQLMFLEEYENDLLIKGFYRKRGDKENVSQVEKGEGTATLYDGDGVFIKKISYKKGAPCDD